MLPIIKKLPANPINPILIFIVTSNIQNTYTYLLILREIILSLNIICIINLTLTKTVMHNQETNMINYTHSLFSTSSASQASIKIYYVYFSVEIIKISQFIYLIVLFWHLTN